MYLCLSPNMAIERNLTAPGYRRASVCRATEMLLLPSGKGFNCARGLRTFGHDVVVTGFVGGHTGALIADLAADEGVRCEWTRIAGESRNVILLRDPAEPGEGVMVNEEGPVVTLDEWCRLVADVTRAAERTQFACLAGSLPPGAPKNEYGELVAGVVASGQPVWVDIAGEALASAVRACPTGIKVNQSEMGALLGRDVSGIGDALEAAAAVRRQGVESVVVTLGGQGALAVGQTGSWHAIAPEVTVVSTIGSGDALLAGLTSALGEGLDLVDALRRGVAAGSANAMVVGGGLIDRARVEALVPRVAISRLA